MKTANCIHCRKKFVLKQFNYRFCEETDDCKEAGIDFKIPKALKKVRKINAEIERINLEIEKAIEKKKENKKLGYLLENTKNKCHEFIRLRDKGLPCISCNNPYNNDFQAGHFYKAELYSNLKFDENNINGQCRQCNLRKEGNESGYRVGIIKRFGAEHLIKLDELAESYKKEDFKWDREQLNEIRDYYKQKLKLHTCK